VLPLEIVPGRPVRDEGLAEAIEDPAYVREYRR
jgi:hypothetical protein